MSYINTELLSRRFAAVRERMLAASGGRSVILQAATKTVSAEVINACAEHCGLRVIGENRVQELLEKYDFLRRDLLEIHFIGHLQTNKVRKIIDKVDMIESVDNIGLAAEINRQAARVGIVMPILIEINIGREAGKGGIMPEDAASFLDEILRFSHIRVCGFMTMAPKCADNEEYSKYFNEVARISLDNQSKICDNLDVGIVSCHGGPTLSTTILSMGMSDSYEAAIRAGATMVRVGGALFGART